MTQRRVVVTLELLTYLPLPHLRQASYWRGLTHLKVVQAQANVMKKEPRPLAATPPHRRRRHG